MKIFTNLVFALVKLPRVVLFFSFAVTLFNFNRNIFVSSVVAPYLSVSLRNI